MFQEGDTPVRVAFCHQPVCRPEPGISPAQSGCVWALHQLGAAGSTAGCLAVKVPPALLTARMAEDQHATQYLIRRDTVWLCLHLAAAGWALGLTLSLLLSAAAGQEEPLTPTSALEELEGTGDRSAYTLTM